MIVNSCWNVRRVNGFAEASIIGMILGLFKMQYLRDVDLKLLSS